MQKVQTWLIVILYYHNRLHKYVFFAVSVTYTRSTFGQKVQPMEYGGLSCQGAESSLQECTASQSFVETFSKFSFVTRETMLELDVFPGQMVRCNYVKN